MQNILLIQYNHIYPYFEIESALVTKHNFENLEKYQTYWHNLYQKPKNIANLRKYIICCSHGENIQYVFESQKYVLDMKECSKHFHWSFIHKYFPDQSKKMRPWQKNGQYFVVYIEKNWHRFEILRISENISYVTATEII